MGFFSDSKSIDFEKIPSTPEQDRARNWLESQYNRNLNFPTRDVTGLTPFQQELQDYVRGSMSGMQNNYNLARGEIQDTLKGNYDPRDSDYWRGFRQEANRLKEEAQTDVRQRSQLGGMLKSSPSAGIEAESNQRYDSAILQELGKLVENERRRRLNAAGMAGQVDSQHLSNVSGANQIADQQRQIEQARNNAVYESALQEILAPYNYQAQLALSLLNEQRYVGIEQTNPSTYSKIKQGLDFGGTVAGIVGGAMAGGAGGGGLSGALSGIGGAV
jgi:hypothetical protein